MPIAFAFVISALLHAAAITMPGWDLPGETEPPPLEARLPPPVTAAAAPGKPKPAPRPRAAKKPAIVPVAAAGVSEPATQAEATQAEATQAEATQAEATQAEATAHEPAEPTAAAPESAAAPDAEAAAPSPPIAPPWPRTGRVHYVVTYGNHGFVIGETVHEWDMQGERYAIRSVAEPKGLAVLRGRMRRQESVGELTAGGLRPFEFRDQREGREWETASFDWPAARVVFSGGRGTNPLAEGTQDLLSVFYQLAWQAPRQSVEVAVATASRVRRWTFEWVGEENVTLPATELTALRLRTSAEGDTTEVWLAPAYGGLPVKIRHVDRGGDVYEQAADSLEFN
jgi:hypothetical protein